MYIPNSFYPQPCLLSQLAEQASVVVFTVEYLLRLCSAHHHRDYKGSTAHPVVATRVALPTTTLTTRVRFSAIKEQSDTFA